MPSLPLIPFLPQKWYFALSIAPAKCHRNIFLVLCHTGALQSCARAVTLGVLLPSSLALKVLAQTNTAVQQHSQAFLNPEDFKSSELTSPVS